MVVFSVVDLVCGDSFVEFELLGVNDCWIVLAGSIVVNWYRWLERLFRYGCVLCYKYEILFEYEYWILVLFAILVLFIVEVLLTQVISIEVKYS
jgi:hypothetical protein